MDIRKYSQGGRVNIDGTYGTNGDFGARALFILNGEMEDVVFDNNTMYGTNGTRPTLYVSGGADRGHNDLDVGSRHR